MLPEPKLNDRGAAVRRGPSATPTGGFRANGTLAAEGFWVFSCIFPYPTSLCNVAYQPTTKLNSKPTRTR